MRIAANRKGSYRLSILGNLTSEELRENGYPGNNALRDQRCALLWVKHHISAFGGDPHKVTINGESAGGASVELHLVARGEDGLFQSAIAQSVYRTPVPTPEEQRVSDRKEV